MGGTMATIDQIRKKLQLKLERQVAAADETRKHLALLESLNSKQIEAFGKDTKN